MDTDLRDLERLLARAPDDEGLRARLLVARARAGLPNVAELVAGMQGLVATLREARAAYVAALTTAFESFVGGAFLENPGLVNATFEWSTDLRHEREWLVFCRATAAWYPPVSAGFLAFAPVLVRCGELEGALRFERTAEGIALVGEDSSVTAQELSDLETLRAEPELFALVLEELRAREVPFRALEVLQADEHTRQYHVWREADGRFPLEGSTDAALAAARSAESALAEAQGRFLAEGRTLWTQLPAALFREQPWLETVGVHGYVPGYNDNWHEEHEQRVYMDAGQLAYARERLTEVGVDADALGLVAEPTRQPERKQLAAAEAVLRPFRELLRDHYGHCFIVALRRSEQGVAVRHARAWHEH